MSDLLAIDDNFLLQDATDWQTSALAQLWRMFNERLLLDGKLVTWTSAGYKEHDPTDLFALKIENGDLVYDVSVVSQRAQFWVDANTGFGRPGVEGAFDSIARIQTGANLQDIVMWQYMQRYISSRAGDWYDSITGTNLNIAIYPLGAETKTSAFRKYTESGVLEYGFVEPGDLLGPWLIEDLRVALSKMRILKHKNMFRDVRVYVHSVANVANGIDGEYVKLRLATKREQTNTSNGGEWSITQVNVTSELQNSPGGSAGYSLVQPGQTRIYHLTYRPFLCYWLLGYHAKGIHTKGSWLDPGPFVCPITGVSWSAGEVQSEFDEYFSLSELVYRNYPVWNGLYENVLPLPASPARGQNWPRYVVTYDVNYIVPEFSVKGTMGDIDRELLI